MRNCSRHAIDLRSALQHKGLWQLTDAVNAEANAVKWLTGITNLTAGEFDPYVVSTLEINKKFAEMIGRERIRPDGCPLCALPKFIGNAGADQAWIDNVTDLMLLFAKVHKLVP